MNTVFKLFTWAAVFALAACGHQKGPTGGPKDTVLPEVAAVTPAELSDISGKKLEVSFTKPMEQDESKRPFYIYPVPQDVSWEWDGNTLIISPYNIESNRNFYLSMIPGLPDQHGNKMEQRPVFVFNSGHLHEAVINGKIEYEEPKDREFVVYVSLFDADSMLVFTKTVSPPSFTLDYLENRPYTIKSWADKDKNGVYNYGTDPVYQNRLNAMQRQSITVQLAYADTIKPAIKGIKNPDTRHIKLTLTEPIEDFDTVSITSLDSTSTILTVLGSYHQQETIFFLTEPQDTINYLLTVYKLKDFKANTALTDTISFIGSRLADKTVPKIISTTPRDGAVSTSNKPQISVLFSEILLDKNVLTTLVHAETQQQIDVRLIYGNSQQFVFEPVTKLANYASYRFSIDPVTQDEAGNTLADSVDISFISVERTK